MFYTEIILSWESLSFNWRSSDDDWLISCHVRPEIQIFAVRIMSGGETRRLMSASQKVKSSNLLTDWWRTFAAQRTSSHAPYFWCISRNSIQNIRVLFGNSWPLLQLSMSSSGVFIAPSSRLSLHHHLLCVTVGPNTQEGFPRQLCECVMLIRPTCCDVVKKKSMRRRNRLSPAIRSKSAAAKKESRAVEKGAVWVSRYGFWFLSVEKALKWD